MSETGARIFIDQIGSEVRVPIYPQRIVSLVPSQTELLFDLGLEDQIAGITKFCIHPQDKYNRKAKVGGTKNFNYPNIDALAPDLIIANKEENTKEGILKLKEKYPVWTSDIYTLEDALDMILSVGQMTGKEVKATEIVSEIKIGFSGLKFENNQMKAAYFIWKNPYMAAASDTFIEEMMKVSGFKNVFQKQTRYPNVSADQIKEANPEFILLSSEPYPFNEKHINEFRVICPEAKIIIVDGEMFSWYGSRLKYAADYFKNLLKEITN